MTKCLTLDLFTGGVQHEVGGEGEDDGGDDSGQGGLGPKFAHQYMGLESSWGRKLVVFHNHTINSTRSVLDRLKLVMGRP